MKQVNITTSTTLIAETFVYKQIISHTPLTCVITQGSPTLPAAEAGDCGINSTMHVLITVVHINGGTIDLCRY